MNFISAIIYITFPLILCLIMGIVVLIEQNKK